MNTDFASDPRPIGVFDSGVGGLTVLRALQSAMPGENFIYLGDTARVPYGTKSAETVKAYSIGLARVLLERDVKMVVIACNTASAHATAEVTAMAAPVPVIGMVEPATAAALAATENNNILVMATQSTTRHASYPNALRAARPAMQVQGVGCQILVALAEEGWVDGPVAHAVVERYIGPFFARAGETSRPDTVILGCTHFPLLRHLVADIAGPDVALIDSGGAAAAHITANWTGRRDGSAGTTKFLVTDNADAFRPVAERFLGGPVGEIEHIDLSHHAESDSQSARAAI